MADWYYAKNGQQRGPVNSAQLKQLAATGEVLPTDMVIKEGGTSWVAASSVPGLFGGNAPVSPGSAGPSGITMAPTAPKPSGPGLGDYLAFRKTCPPLVIGAFFWIFLAFWTITIFHMVYQLLSLSSYANFSGTLYLLGCIFFLLVLVWPMGLLAVRLWCDSLIVNKRIHETLTSLKDLQQGRR